jgi:hypothetical protein
MTQLTNAQTELLKYLHSQIAEASKQRNSDAKLLSHWLNAKEEEHFGLEDVIAYEINKLNLSIESLNLRFEWLVEQMNQFVPEELK